MAAAEEIGPAGAWTETLKVDDTNPAADPEAELKSDEPSDDEPEDGNWGPQAAAGARHNDLENLKPPAAEQNNKLASGGSAGGGGGGGSCNPVLASAGAPPGTPLTRTGESSGGHSAAGGGSTDCAAFRYVLEAPFTCAPAWGAAEARGDWLQRAHGPNAVAQFFLERVREGKFKDPKYRAVFRGPAEVGPTSKPPQISRGGVALWARKWRRSTVNQYVISVDEKDLAAPRNKRGAGYMGKLKSINGERVYCLYDKGEKYNGTRKEIAAVVYTHERAASDTIFEPKMEVAVPTVGELSPGGGVWGMSKGAAPKREEDTLRSLFSSARCHGSENFLAADTLTALREMPPNASQPPGDDSPAAARALLEAPKDLAESVKNFRLQLSLPSSHQYRGLAKAAAGGNARSDAAQAVPLLTMAKIRSSGGGWGGSGTVDRFLVTYTQPFSALQAFGIALSRFDTKQVA